MLLLSYFWCFWMIRRQSKSEESNPYKTISKIWRLSTYYARNCANELKLSLQKICKVLRASRKVISSQADERRFENEITPWHTSTMKPMISSHSRYLLNRTFPHEISLQLRFLHQFQASFCLYELVFDKPPAENAITPRFPRLNKTIDKLFLWMSIQ